MATLSPGVHLLEAAWTRLETYDHRLMRRVNHWHAPRWLRLWLVAATRGGDGWMWWAMALVVAAFGGEQRLRALAAMAFAVTLGVLVFLRMKRYFGRKRPTRFEPHCWATLLPPDQFSFPSGHTITAIAVAQALGYFYPEVKPGLYFCAASVALSRIMLGMHFLSDVLAGLAIGASLGYGSARLFA